jgi:hypothetical protein
MKFGTVTVPLEEETIWSATGPGAAPGGIRPWISVEAYARFRSG